ncbi:PREDICTED: trefoil factor 2 isoform X1 [Myotis davidii]|uniref:trefoil factor 2 isoform X1 n=1 Tax=Myotis davidii TaxID=225400 RepID=UPI0007679ACE|nr:PREDICTED: trefoil factor 2 isoform X1 [Myotis davidii]
MAGARLLAAVLVLGLCAMAGAGKPWRIPGVCETSERGLPPGQGQGDPWCWGARLRRGTGQDAPPGAPWSPALITFHLGLHVGPSVHLFLEAPCQCSRMNPDSRKNCGFPGITSEQCFAAGCCFDTTVPGVPWCFTPLPMQDKEECVMEVSARVNCGYPGISSEVCASRNCCFSDTIPEVPWCFFPKPVQDCHY